MIEYEDQFEPVPEPHSEGADMRDKELAKSKYDLLIDLREFLEEKDGSS